MLFVYFVLFVLGLFLLRGTRKTAKWARDWEAEVERQMRLNLERAERIERLIRREEARLSEADSGLSDDVREALLTLISLAAREGYYENERRAADVVSDWMDANLKEAPGITRLHRYKVEISKGG